METTKIYNLIVLDESGSMNCIKQQTINGFNETVQTIASAQKKFPEQIHLVSLVSFNSSEIKTVFDRVPVSQVNQLNDKTYSPDGNTPLFDALGLSLTRLRYQINTKENHQVLVSIITDGEENSSREFSGKMVKNLIDELKAMDWVFTFIGANIDVEQVASQISINNYISFNQSSAGTNAMYAREKNARMNMYDKMSKGVSKKDLLKNYFDNENS